MQGTPVLREWFRDIAKPTDPIGWAQRPGCESSVKDDGFGLR
jgi:hypothetical protein